MDFTLSTYRSLLMTLIDSGYTIRKVRDMANGNVNPGGRQVILRHDVDRKPGNSLKTAEIEALNGIGGTYYFRAVSPSFDDEIIRRISDLGHEIGYHYEDLDTVSRKSKVQSPKSAVVSRKSKVESPKSKEGVQESGDIRERDLVKMAFDSFRENLARLREVVAVDTICMHGSPMSRYDSRLMWKYFDYGELNITAEPYFDFSLDDMLYLTDTGRRWDGSAVSVRDKVYLRDDHYYEQWVRKPVPGSAMAMTVKGMQLQKQFGYRKTTDILASARAGRLPGMMLLTVHPQRWSSSFPVWMSELVVQNLKNTVKYIINKRHI